MGRDGSIYLMGWTGGYVLLALLLAPYLRKFGQYTVPDFVGQRYYSQTARFVAICCAIFISFTYVAGQMRGVGVVFSRFLEVDISIGVVIGMGIVLFYAVLGGMKGITYTQVAQYCILIFAFLVPAFFISIMMTGNVIPQLGFGSTLVGSEGVYLLDKLDGLHRELGFDAYTGGGQNQAGRVLYNRSFDGRDSRFTACDHPLFHSPQSKRCKNVSRLGTAVHRDSIHDSSCCRRICPDKPYRHYQ
jgi:cation/acetate symporter